MILLAFKKANSSDQRYRVGAWLKSQMINLPLGWRDGDGSTFMNPIGWCPLPTLEDETEARPIQLSQTHINALTKDLARKRDEIESLTAELQAVKAELNERLHERTQAFLAKEIKITKERDALRKRIAKNRPGPNGLLAINQDEYDAMFSVDGRAE